MINQHQRRVLPSLSDKWFEMLLVTIVLGVTVIAHHLLNVAPVIVHFFYLPVIIAAFYFGRNLACLTAAFSVLSVGIFAMINPEHYMTSVDSKMTLMMTLIAWGGFLGLNALLVGTLCDQRAEQMRDLRHAHMGIIEILSKYLQAADQYTKSHSMRVADLAEAIANEMGLKQAEIEDIRVGALLHDIGKVEISTRLIQKAAELDQEERTEMASHTVRGAELVRSLGSVLEGAIPTIMHHHDHYSPESKASALSGNDIPIGARVVAVADAYDAIVTDRPYRRGRMPQEALAIIREASGKQFDPQVVAAFDRVVLKMADEPEAQEGVEAARNVADRLTEELIKM
ncbi:MAG: HD domain-containing phosphohydrolase [Phycisphaerae bacterium]